MSLNTLLKFKHWVFDMDGMLTIAQHDFEAIRSELGVPVGQTILEALQEMPEEESAPLHKQLNEIELELAHQAKPADGAQELLEQLLSQGANIGILTRNNAMNIGVTLKAAWLAHYFSVDNLLSRDCIKPKPAPDGILSLLNQWQASPKEGVMVGDFIHDLSAGKAAGTITVYIDRTEEFPFKQDADVCISTLIQLIEVPLN